MDNSTAQLLLTMLFLRADQNTGSAATAPVLRMADALLHGLPPAAAITALVHLEAWDVDGAAINALYRNLLGRAPDTGGFQAWLAFGNHYDADHGGQLQSLSFAALNAIGTSMLTFNEARAHGATAANVQSALDYTSWDTNDGFAFAAANALRIDFGALPANHQDHVALVASILPDAWR